MFLPKTVQLFNEDDAQLFDIRSLKKRILILFTGWISLISFGASVFVGVDLYLEEREIGRLKSEIVATSIQVSELRQQYNTQAKIYLEEQKIARVVTSVNRYLDKKDVNLWVKTLGESGDSIYRNLNTHSKIRMEIDTTMYSLKTGVSLLLALGAMESDFRVNASSNKDATGPFQLRQITAVQIGLENRFDPVSNIRGGAKYLVSMLQKYHKSTDQLELALASYNAGVTRVNAQWIPAWGREWSMIHAGLSSDGRFKETRDYVASIIVMSQLFASGEWSNMDALFWSNFRRSLFSTEYASIYETKLGNNSGISEDL